VGPGERCDPAEVPTEPEPEILELDLDEPAPRPPGPPAPRDVAEGPIPEATGVDARRGSSGWGPWRARVAWVAVGALVGALAVHVVETRNSGGPAVRVALGTFGARRLNRRVGDTLTLLVSTVAVNEGPVPLEIRSLRAAGAGAALTETFRGEGDIFPLELAPGQTANMPFALDADCAVGAGETPRITVVVGRPGSDATEVEVAIPDLDRAWQALLAPGSCGPGTSA
jgi:uncharacterized membrane protein YeaQ/YmgE (transglycosylase-associated protein family)